MEKIRLDYLIIVVIALMVVMSGIRFHSQSTFEIAKKLQVIQLTQ